MLAFGDKAPDFTLMSDKDEEVTLSGFFGNSNVVVYFYPKDNTPGCTSEACSFQDSLESIRAKDTVVLGISPDSVKSHQNFIGKYNLSFTLLSDPEHKVAEKYFAWAEKKLYGRTYFGIVRSTFIINKEGRIQKSFYKVNVDGHVDEVMKILETM